MPEQSPAAGKRLRKDAAVNAERLLAAAIRSGLNKGRSVPMADIAAEAGVGVGTLYRRYPNRDALVEALQMRAYRLLIEMAEEALATSETGLEAVERYLIASFVRRDELVLPLHGAPRPSAPESLLLSAQLKGLITAMAERGHLDHTIRTDVTPWTIVQFGAMSAQPMSDVAGWQDSVREQRNVFLRGIDPRPTAE